jgi:aspartate-semialdehyde dehydrogenase
MSWTVAIVGASGAVGRTMRTCLESSSIEVRELRLLATPRSAGMTFPFRGHDCVVEAVTAELFEGVDLALFSAGAGPSGDWARVATGRGAWVVDNSSRFRMDPEVPLVVPEVNAEAIPSTPGLIANPNCSTIQMVTALAPIHRRWGLQRVAVTTYQAVSGTGEKGILALARELERWRRAQNVSATEVSSLHGFVFGPGDDRPAPDSPYAHPVLGNALPQCDVFLEDGYTREEQKLIDETRKILGLPELVVQPTCVRVPVVTGHSEAIYVETEHQAHPDEVRALLAGSPGIVVVDDPQAGGYPLARSAAGTDPVWVGRIRQDRCVPHGLHLWVVADNLRKGAALNAVQIAERIWGSRAR